MTECGPMQVVRVPQALVVIVHITHNKTIAMPLKSHAILAVNVSLKNTRSVISVHVYAMISFNPSITWANSSGDNLPISLPILSVESVRI